MSATLSASTPARVRLYDVDWLRVLAILLIFVYHAARPFDTMEPWHIKDSQTAGWMVYPMVVGAQFMMPLFWVMSGISTRFALGAHAAGEFVRRRLLRLLVPVVTLGWFILSPVQVYIESTTAQGYNAPPFSGTFWQFLPHYHGRLLRLWRGTSRGTACTCGTWCTAALYLAFLAAVSLPAQRRRRKVVDALARFLVRPGGIYLLGLWRSFRRSFCQEASRSSPGPRVAGPSEPTGSF
jgi:peptidoglycan/LPS O-acetylase OafA/YrhL